MAQPITRKTLAQKIGGDMTAERIRKNERTLGLDRCRIKTGTRSVLYDLDQSRRQLKPRGITV